MGEDAVNDDLASGTSGPRESDPSGQAAILLVESLIHGLIAKSVLSVSDAIEIVDIAVEVRDEVGTPFGEPWTIHRRSIAILNSIGHSLRGDLPPAKREMDGATPSDDRT